MDVLADGAWERVFTEKPAVFTREKRSEHGWISCTDVTLGSDAFFPFGDNIERAHKSGVKYIAQPGGSVRDDDVIATLQQVRYGDGIYRNPSVPSLMRNQVLHCLLLRAILQWSLKRNVEETKLAGVL